MPEYPKPWHIKRQYNQSEPIIRKTYEGWECYLEADEVSALGITPSIAYNNWKKKTICLEKQHGYV